MSEHPYRDMHEQIIRQREERPDYWTVEPLIEGETIQRSYRSTYPRVAATQPTRTFSLIPRMIELLEETPLPEPEYTAWAIEHLRNAANEELPEDVRTVHYDIAGVQITRHQNDYRHPAFRVWMEGNGA